MKKQDVCVYIENEAQLKEARELLNEYGEKIDEKASFNLSLNEDLNYLQFGGFKDICEWWLAIVYDGEELIKITLSELEEILKAEKL